MILILSLWYGTMITILVRMLISTRYWNKVNKETDRICKKELLNKCDMIMALHSLENMKMFDVYKPWKPIPIVEHYNLLKKLTGEK